MKGLLIKDMELTLSNKRTVPLFLFIMLMLLVTGGEDMVSFAVSFLVMICGMLVISTISYDEFEHGTAYLLTLPISRKMYVAEKYIFMAFSMFAGLIVSMAVSFACIQIRGFHINMDEWIVGCIATFAVVFLLLAIMLPIQLKYGGENGRIILIAFMACIFILVFAGARLAAWIGLDVEKIASQAAAMVKGMSIGMTLGLCVAIYVVVIAASVMISNRIMQKKEF